MHREISHAGNNLQPESRLFLYLLTAVLALLIGADLWLWLSTGGEQIDLFGWRFRLALVPALLGGARILYGSLDSLFEGRIGADLAIAVACGAAILARRPEVAEEVVFVGLLGECLEHLTFERTQRAVRSIVAICPRRCWRLRDGREERILVADLRAGDHVVVKPGARVPADGVVVEGRSSLDVGALDRRKSAGGEGAQATRCWPARSTNSGRSPSRPGASPNTPSSAKSSNLPPAP